MENPPPKFSRTVFLVLALLALVIRLPHLGDRPMHTDEAVNAYITGELLAGKAYHYDPQDRHGPVLYLLAAPTVRLAGAKDFASLTESELRLTPVLAGSLMILLFGAGVECFGFIPCLIAAALFAFAPLPVYYSRYFIHETLFVATTLALILAGWRTIQTHSLPSAALTGLCAAVLLAGKETAVIHFFALTVAAVTVWYLKVRGPWPPAKVFLTAGAAFAVTAVALFTWFGGNWSALADLVRAAPNFAARADGQGHAKPLGYYFELLAAGWSGGIILGLAALGILRSHRIASRLFLAVYGLLTVLIYSAIPYKTPWLALNFWLPVALLVGFVIEDLWHVTTKCSVRAGWLAGMAALALLITHDTREFVFHMPAEEQNPYAYAHTTEDILGLPARIAEISRERHLSQPRIAVVAKDAWPLPWYLRQFSHVGYWLPGQTPGPWDFCITPTDVDGELALKLKDSRPEFFGVRPNVLLILWIPPHPEIHD